MFSKSVSALAAIAFLGVLPGPRQASSQTSQKKPTKNEVAVAHARERVLAILREENGCTAWFREADPDAAGVFESLQIGIAKKKQEFVQRTTNERGEHSYRHPWGGRSNQMAGPGSLVQVNPDGPFFTVTLPVVETRPGGQILFFGGFRILTVGGFPGDSPEAQTTILLHELAHVIGRIPEDDDSWDGRSSRNTDEVLRNCRGEIVETAQRASHASR
ncbi:MAG: hypothetical protein JSS69_08490 [Acidobacteria bacterium]|nr:hypothetical protein [Acidobacteriota bacterium]MBS1865943.1 hypothetical protein [Acidobacteriota bacterium]